ncbi:hypothetical protein HIM_05149 [Hirsutella minnesotensis 3608]|uniref:Aminoglycoside phosphotransferase domain-containing protein n=1 Tax=Hirsutella minnesotensis 3608 TaxID=1043627 RepID=A0A0F7ZUU1_9HYPO|nr:hypothetical protein HIM_05149 [Hirsutella minnesotensis 3608]
MAISSPSTPQTSSAGAHSFVKAHTTAQLSSECPILITHGDITARNMPIRDSRIVALLYWEFCGWYPNIGTIDVLAVRGMDRVGWEPLGCHMPSVFKNRYDREYVVMKFITSLS